MLAEQTSIWVEWRSDGIHDRPPGRFTAGGGHQ